MILPSGHGQLGNGTTEDCLIPRKIMENVAEFHFGGFGGANYVCGYIGAAITNNGALYTWGSNRSGQLGIGIKGEWGEENYLTPMKIMDNVSDFLIASDICIALIRH